MTLQSVAGDIGATPSQVAIAWVQRRSPAIRETGSWVFGAAALPPG
jgi:aryl-alcohol dehydrogenase-like predicted oxidoreductase